MLSYKYNSLVVLNSVEVLSFVYQAINIIKKERIALLSNFHTDKNILFGNGVVIPSH